jgi:hypothetical protein
MLLEVDYGKAAVAIHHILHYCGFLEEYIPVLPLLTFLTDSKIVR